MRIHLNEPMRVTVTRLDEHRFRVSVRMDNEEEPDLYWVVNTSTKDYHTEEKPLVENDLDVDIRCIVSRFGCDLHDPLAKEPKVNGNGQKYVNINWRSVACAGL